MKYTMLNKEKVLQRAEKLEFQLKEIGRNLVNDNSDDAFKLVHETLITLAQLKDMVEKESEHPYRK